MINKEPVYIQINKALRLLIIKENYSAGDKFLTERSICEMYNVSRSTANKSLSSLVSENILEFKKGIGTFIKSVPLQNNKYSLFGDPIEILKKQQLKFTVELLEPSSPFYKNYSNIDRVVTQIRRIELEHETLAVELLYFSKVLTPLFNMENHRDSLLSLLESDPSINIKETKDFLNSKISSEMDKKLFFSNKDFPLLEICSRSRIEEGNTDLTIKTLYNGKLASLIFTGQKKEVSLLIKL